MVVWCGFKLSMPQKLQKNYIRNKIIEKGKIEMKKKIEKIKQYKTLLLAKTEY